MGQVSIAGVGPWLHKNKKATPADVAAGVDNTKYATAAAIQPDQARQDVVLDDHGALIAWVLDLMTNDITQNEWAEDFSAESMDNIVLAQGCWDEQMQKICV